MKVDVDIKNLQGPYIRHWHVNQARHFVSVATMPETAKNNDSARRIDLYRLRCVVAVWSQQMLPHLQTSRSSVSKTNEVYVVMYLYIDVWRKLSK